MENDRETLKALKAKLAELQQRQNELKSIESEMREISSRIYFLNKKIKQPSVDNQKNRDLKVRNWILENINAGDIVVLSNSGRANLKKVVSKSAYGIFMGDIPKDGILKISKNRLGYKHIEFSDKNKFDATNPMFNVYDYTPLKVIGVFVKDENNPNIYNYKSIRKDIL